jgi:hypothetical protein
MDQKLPVRKTVTIGKPRTAPVNPNAPSTSAPSQAEKERQRAENLRRNGAAQKPIKY